ncbi:L-fucose isomerase [Clostridium chauvoei]|uniref:L-fucose isomerase n=2 Tax=Clostridium chauvoei TaxID=46867 RepID=S6EZD1_9CLOT|nr:L-fucose isomerase [Clostridium chauvoei]ATD55042.1 L-fucose isomerase [Clostridium chauvoei]ATD57283.1 L-fucose isomerase [Clostridium chauvoei]MBX7279385.1 L-fucose isomerase [Clostridium chauvoei]MBX7282529.1 L-fucose isomerase [Clostridium chauvoei]MBX7285583.1 L-fucose isomerase [Clostridium chauvoei]
MNRLNGDFPKVSIRPTIDGRRQGVRESLEEQTMGMAKQVSELISKNLYYPNGESVRCVISDTTIGGVSEAARCAEKFSKEGVGLTITVTPCWCYGSETIDMDPHIPKAIWGFNGTERPGAVYLAAALAGHTQFGLPAFGIYGKDVQNADCTEIPEDVKEKLLRFTRCGLAIAIMKGKSYLSVGSVSMGIAGSIVNQKFFQKYLGMRNEYVDMSEITRRIDRGIYDKDEFELAFKWVKENCKEGRDRNSIDKQRSKEEKNKIWETVIKMTLITRDLLIGNPKLEILGFKEESEGHNAIAGGFQGQRHWTDHSPNGDFMEAILNSSFDWNGIRESFVFATENDSLNAIPMLFGHLLTNTSQIFADVRTYWSKEAVKEISGKDLTGKASNGFIHLINSGAATLDASGKQKDSNGDPTMKPFWQIKESEAKACLDATTWWPAIDEYFRGGGFSSKFISEGGMPLTMSRICMVDGLGPVLQLVEGYSVDLDNEIATLIDNRTDCSWPTTWFAPNLTGEGVFKDVYSVMNNWGANHGAISYGHIGAELITLASMLRIPVAMHNVPEDKIFRPSAWAMFGSKDLEGADYRACNNFGPIYK